MVSETWYDFWFLDTAIRRKARGFCSKLEICVGTRYGIETAGSLKGVLTDMIFVKTDESRF